MKQLIFAFSSLLYFTVCAQENNTGIPIPMKNGVIFYERAFPVNKTVSKDKLYRQAEKWLKTSFRNSKEKISIDKNTGKISSKGLFKVITDETTGHHYWIKPAVTVIINDDSCSIQLYNYYEKPVMPGVTNDLLWSLLLWPFEQSQMAAARSGLIAPHRTLLSSRTSVTPSAARLCADWVSSGG